MIGSTWLRRSLWIGVSLLLALIAFPRSADAEQADAEERTDAHSGISPDTDETVEWNPAWPRVHAAEYVVTGAAVAGVVAGMAAAPKNDVHWQGTNAFDDGARDALRFGSASGRDAAGTASDVLLAALILQPNVDAGLVWLAHGNPDAAWQMTMINAESFALTMAVTTALKFAAGRERPYARECRENGHGDDPECMGSDYASSFLSGHSALAFTGAGLVCAHHAHMPIYGGGLADDLACPMAMTAAAATGFLRVAADKHYTTDVLTGAAVGVASGWLMPELLHYQFGKNDDQPDRVRKAHSDTDAPQPSFSLAPMLGTSKIGVTVSGTF